MSQSEVLTSSATITCLCGRISEPGSLIVATHFPIPAGICNCSICRTTTGAIFFGGVRLKSAPSAASLEACTKYAVTPVCTRWHCQTCGSPAFFRHQDADSDFWLAAQGAVDRTDDHKQQVDTFKLKYSIYSASCADGGILARMAEVSALSLQDLACYATGFKDDPVKLAEAPRFWQSQLQPGSKSELTQDTANPSSSSSQSKDPSPTPISCSCGSISLTLLPATARPASADPALVERYTRANGTKYLAKLCMCRSDRLATGIPFVPWSYVFSDCIRLPPSSAPIPFATNFDNDAFYASVPGLAALKTYRSSADIRRSFCGVCGASVFVEAKYRPEVLVLAPGLIRAGGGGALAEELLSWHWKSVTWPAECESREWLDGVTGGQTALSQSSQL